MMSKKRKDDSRKRTIPLIGGLVALIGSGIYALRRRRNNKAT
jgi:LPXTG-motif cell wall-anchored protein